MVDTKEQLVVLRLKNGRHICARQILNCKPNERRDLRRFKTTVDGWVVINDQNMKGKDTVYLRLLQSIWLNGAPTLEEPQNSDFVSYFVLDIFLHNFLNCSICNVISRLCISRAPNLFLHGVQKCLKQALGEETQSVTLKEKITEYLSVNK
jgi:hypothetical protein